MSFQPTDVIEVLAWGHRVGAVAQDPDTGWYAFAYDPDWVAGGFELAPLHMPLRREPYEFPELRPETYARLPALLADALPDAFGHALVDAWMAGQGIDADRITPLDRLAYAADRAMGALEFRPPARDTASDAPSPVQLADLVLAARHAVRGRFDTDATTRAALRQLIQVGTSAGGAWAKAVLAFNPATFQLRSDHGTPAEGFEQWLVKLDGVSATGMHGRGDRLGEGAPYGRIEYAYSRMAGAAGVEMRPCLLLAEGPRHHFMTQRFDRGPGGARHHLISLCAMAHLDYDLVATHSYDQYLQTVVALGLGPGELQQAFRRMVFNVMAVNRDDHTKNFAFLRAEHAGWHLAPAYDVTHAYNPDSRWTSHHLMAVNGKFDGIALGDLHAVGARHEVPGYRMVVQEVRDAVATWPRFAADAELDARVTQAIAADHARFRPA